MLGYSVVTMLVNIGLDEKKQVHICSVRLWVSKV